MGGFDLEFYKKYLDLPILVKIDEIDGILWYSICNGRHRAQTAYLLGRTHVKAIFQRIGDEGKISKLREQHKNPVKLDFSDI